MFQSPKMTNAGKALYYDSLAGDGIVFTKIKMGKGELDQSIVNMTDLIDPVVSINAVLSEANDGSYVDISGSFSNAGLSQGFYWREIGLFAQNPEKPNDRSADILYCYQNAFDTADFIPTASVETVEKYITIPIVLSDDVQISCLIDQSLVFATKKELEEHNENPNAHEEAMAKKANITYCICETASDTGVKIATVVTGTFDELTVGAAVDVRFVHTNVSTTPMLNVNGTGERFIKLYGITAAKENQWAAGSIIRFVYNGTFWIMQNGTLASENSYGMTKLSSSTDSEDKGSAATPSAVKAAYDRASTAIMDAAAAQSTADTAKTAAEAAQAAADKASNRFYGICNSASSATEKEAVILANDDPNDPDKLDASFKLEDGVSVDIWFHYFNSADQITLNVNGTGAKIVALTTSSASLPPRLWKANSIVRFVYDADSETWIIPNTSLATASFYGLTKLCNNLNTDDDNLAASASTVYFLESKIAEIEDDMVANYLPKTGGTVNGGINFDQASGARGNASIWKNNVEVDNGTKITDADEDNNTATLNIQAKNQRVQLLLRKATDTGHYAYDLYGRHNVTSGTTDLTAGSSALATGNIYLVYE